MFIQPSRHIQGYKSVMIIRLLWGNGTGLVTGEAQWTLALLNWGSREEGGGHAWLLSCVGMLGLILDLS